LVLNGYSDWYLPSKAELDKVIVNASVCGIVLGSMSNASNWIWTSSQYDISRTYAYGPFDGYTSKSAGHKVYPIRTF
jgi:hypothetical protein